MHIKLTKILKKVKQYRLKSDSLFNINNLIHTSCINRMNGNCFVCIDSRLYERDARVQLYGRAVKDKLK